MKRDPKFDEFRYHQLCARATLYPGLSFEEAVEKVDEHIERMIEQLETLEDYGFTEKE